MGDVANDCKQLILCKSVVLIMLLILNYVNYFFFFYFSFLVIEPSHQSPLLVERKVQTTGVLMCLDPCLAYDKIKVSNGIRSVTFIFGSRKTYRKLPHYQLNPCQNVQS